MIKLINFDRIRKHWIFKSKKKETISIILDGYGSEKGLFEICCSWEKDVRGYLNFIDVANALKRLQKRENGK